MKTPTSFTTTFTVDQSPEAVFAAINHVRGWWSENIIGITDQPGGQFEYRYQDLHRSIQKITEWIPSRKIVWHIVESQVHFVRQAQEWTGTNVVFEITPKNGKTELRFTHVGLEPAVECYEKCSKAWEFYVGESLYQLITTGKGDPDLRTPAASASPG